MKSDLPTAAPCNLNLPRPGTTHSISGSYLTIRTPSGQYGVPAITKAALEEELQREQQALERIQRRISAYAAVLAGESVSDPRALEW